MIQAIILAAGASSRFGSPKQLIKIGEEFLLDKIMKFTMAAKFEHTAVILGANADLIKAQIWIDDVEVVLNEEWSKGLSTSIRKGVELARNSKSEAVIFIPADMPFINERLFKEIIRQHKSDPKAIVVCNYGEGIGPPTLFPKSYFESLTELASDSGGKSIVNKADNVIQVKFLLGRYDVDTKEDLEKIRKMNET